MWRMARRCRSVSLSLLLTCPRSLAHLPAFTCSKRWLHHLLLRPSLPAALRPQLGPAELLLPSSSKQSKLLLASFHFINTHHPHCPSTNCFSTTSFSIRDIHLCHYLFYTLL